MGYELFADEDGIVITFRNGDKIVELSLDIASQSVIWGGNFSDIYWEQGKETFLDGFDSFMERLNV